MLHRELGDPRVGRALIAPGSWFQTLPAALQAELAAAEATSRRTGHAAMAGLNLPAGRYYLVLAGTPASYALHIDLRTTILRQRIAHAFEFRPQEAASA